MEKLLQLCKDDFVCEFRSLPTHGAYAPGRVNLIGDHVDYNDGFVLPMAIPYGTLILVAKTSTSQNQHRIKTLNSYADSPYIVNLISTSPPIDRPKWARYIQGVLNQFPSPIPYLDIIIGSSVPLGAGLSSSASLEVAMFSALEAITGKKVSGKEKALACQKAEHEYAKVPCGIMDQFVVSLGQEGYALLIDCRSLEWRQLPLNNEELVFLVTNSNVRHELGSGEYAVRRSQCEEAANLLGLKSLRDATVEDINRLLVLGASNVVFRRGRHVITEISRTQRAASALESGDYHTFGSLMIESHNSLRDDFEVSCPELDTLVSLVVSIDGVLGSRMTGGGFGGCTVSLVKKDTIDYAIKTIKDGYTKNASFFIMKPSAGVILLDKNNLKY